MRSVHLHVDRIAVEGLSAAEQRKFAHALETRLRALAEAGANDGIAQGGHRAIGTINAGVLRPGTSADRAAKQVVDAIRGRLSGGNKAGQISGPRGGEARSHG